MAANPVAGTVGRRGLGCHVVIPSTDRECLVEAGIVWTGKTGTRLRCHAVVAVPFAFRFGGRAMCSVSFYFDAAALIPVGRGCGVRAEVPLCEVTSVDSRRSRGLGLVGSFGASSGRAITRSTNRTGISGGFNEWKRSPRSAVTDHSIARGFEQQKSTAFTGVFAGCQPVVREVPMCLGSVGLLKR
jgi:hypothetical protein